jgi:hypothetical protein
MNDKLIQIGLDSGMLNYVDNETPRHYFLSGHADEQDLQKFAELIVKECAKVSEDDITDGDACCTNTAYRIASQIKKHFGLTE